MCFAAQLGVVPADCARAEWREGLCAFHGALPGTATETGVDGGGAATAAAHAVGLLEWQCAATHAAIRTRHAGPLAAPARGGWSTGWHGAFCSAGGIALCAAAVGRRLFMQGSARAEARWCRSHAASARGRAGPDPRDGRAAGTAGLDPLDGRAAAITTSPGDASGGGAGFCGTANDGEGSEGVRTSAGEARGGGVSGGAAAGGVGGQRLAGTGLAGTESVGGNGASGGGRV